MSAAEDAAMLKALATELMRMPEVRREARYRHGELFAYAIQAGTDGPIKIGVTVNPGARLKTLQTGNHEVLVGLAAWPVAEFEERDIHETYAYARRRGEWFHPDPELVEFVLRAGGDFEDWDLR